MTQEDVKQVQRMVKAVNASKKAEKAAARGDAEVFHRVLVHESLCCKLLYTRLNALVVYVIACCRPRSAMLMRLCSTLLALGVTVWAPAHRLAWTLWPAIPPRSRQGRLVQLLW